MRTIIYIDGFNLYYGALKNTPYKWLNLKAMSTALLNEDNDIVGIKYFTARVSGRGNDQDKPIHQDAYIKALKHTIPDINIYFGQFTTHNVTAKLVEPIGNTRYVEVIRTSEKGSDVNLAVHLLNDAWLDSYDCAVLVSRDSDLAESVRMVKSYHRQKKVGLFTMRKQSSKELIRVVDFVRNISTSALAGSQLPETIAGTGITKPHDW